MSSLDAHSHPSAAPSAPHFWPRCTSIPRSILQKRGAAPAPGHFACLTLEIVTWKKLLATTREGEYHRTSRVSPVALSWSLLLGFGPQQMG